MNNSTKTLLIVALMAVLTIGCGDEDSNATENAGGEAGAMGGAAGEAAPEEGWNAVCEESSDCADPTNFCAKQPGDPEGYCSIPCTTTADCPYGDWSCNVIGGCAEPIATWCGPREEEVTFAGIITACD
jgi:hypothetical protein